MTRVHEAVKALALCHNVTPVVEETDPNPKLVNGDIELATKGEEGPITYQAASPDEVSCDFEFFRFYLYVDQALQIDTRANIQLRECIKFAFFQHFGLLVSLYLFPPKLRLHQNEVSTTEPRHRHCVSSWNLRATMPEYV